LIDNAFTNGSDNPPAAMIVQGHAGDSSATAYISLGGTGHNGVVGWNGVEVLSNKYGTGTIYLDGSGGNAQFLGTVNTFGGFMVGGNVGQTECEAFVGIVGGLKEDDSNCIVGGMLIRHYRNSIDCNGSCP
jgi:hypothetical protein